MKQSKEQLIEGLLGHIKSTQEAVTTELEKVSKTAHRPIYEINQLKKEDREYAKHLQALSLLRYTELEALNKSPFFSKCVIAHKTADIRQNKEKTLYFGKYEFSEQGIYSWVAPIATIRFANAGDTSFRLPNGKLREVKIFEKEQYMIVDGKPMFYARETETEPRELIYQEHFSLKKGAFMLPEIVEVMEKAQDDVIRASHFGPFAISGPAGSGKTTLALHRVAYLAQSPETAELYPSDSITVFVQDTSTKEYFSHLLPELGIHNVSITTFFEWAAEILKLEELRRSADPTHELEKLYIKDQTLKEGAPATWKRNAWYTLESAYKKLGSKELVEHFAKQKNSNALDRIDLTIALALLREDLGRLEVHIESNRAMRMGKIVHHVEKRPVQFALAVVDEFQNYLPEQLDLFKSCLKSETQSIIYVGDMSQQILHGTVRNWSEFKEEISSERQIKLHKVYRNTKEILRYIQSIGYTVEIPEALKEGVPVVEHLSIGGQENDFEVYKQETLAQLDSILEKSAAAEFPESIGIIGLRRSDVAFISEYIASKQMPEDKKKLIRVSTIAESQGVEFDIVCLVGIHPDIFVPEKLKLTNGIEEGSETLVQKFKEESLKIRKDLVYIALTRAIAQMHVFGTAKLKNEFVK